MEKLEHNFLEGKYTPFEGTAELSASGSETPTVPLSKASTSTGKKSNLIFVCMYLCAHVL